MVGGQFQGGGTVSSLMGLALKTDLIDVAVLTDRSGLDSEVRLVAPPGRRWLPAPELN